MIAICVGHSRRGDLGALSVEGVSEWHYNCDIAKRAFRMLLDLGHEACVIQAYKAATYGAAMEWLAGELKKRGAECAVELHFNCAESEAANGHEWLHWHASLSGKRLAKAMQGRMGNTFPGNKSRGLISICSGMERGAGFLRKTPCPAVICEPFFGSNRREWTAFSDNRELLAEVIALGIDDWKGGAK